MSAEKLKYFVNGEYVESKTDKYYTLVNPSTGETTGYAPCCTTRFSALLQRLRLLSRAGAQLRRLREHRFFTTSVIFL